MAIRFKAIGAGKRTVSDVAECLFTLRIIKDATRVKSIVDAKKGYKENKRNDVSLICGKNTKIVAIVSHASFIGISHHRDFSGNHKSNRSKPDERTLSGTLCNLNCDRHTE